MNLYRVDEWTEDDARIEPSRYYKTKGRAQGAAEAQHAQARRDGAGRQNVVVQCEIEGNTVDTLIDALNGELDIVSEKVADTWIAKAAKP